VLEPVDGLADKLTRHPMSGALADADFLAVLAWVGALEIS
jgi:hypothetical protein